MPKDRPIGTFSGGPILPRWLRAFFAWEPVKQLGVYEYQRNTVTGGRRAVRTYAGGHCPFDRQWVETGEWTRPSNPPSGGSCGSKA